MATTQNPLATTQVQPQQNLVLNSVLHDLVLTGLTAAAIFVKNPASQQTAGQLINLVNSILKEHGQAL